MKFGLIHFVPFLLLAGTILVRMAYPGPVEEIQYKVFDTFQRLKPRSYEPAPVRIVDLDDESLARLGQWPWPRTRVAQLVERLAELGAAVIALDIIFSEPDRTSPRQILPLWPNTPEVSALRPSMDKLPDHDQVLAGQIARVPVVTAFALSDESNAVEPALKAAFAHAGDDPVQYLPSFPGAIAPLKVIEEAASGNGSFTIWSDPDGIIRRLPLLFRLREKLYPALGAEALRVAQGASTYLVKSSGASREVSWGEHTGVVSVKIGRFVVPTDGQGRLWLYDTGPVPERSLAAWRVLAWNEEESPLQGSIVFVGTSAQGLKDIRPTATNPVTAGVEIHAQLVEQILLGEFLERPDWAYGAELVYLLVLGVCLVILLPRIGAIWCALLGVGTVLFAVAFSWYAFTRLHWLLDPVFPSLVALVAYLSASMIHFLRMESERREIRNAFSRYMSPVLVDRLAKNPSLLKLGGETRNITVLFADIRGFTTISEQYDAQSLTRFINRFLTPMTDLILRRNGTIDKYMGDCIMSFWNAPLDDKEHASHACQAAIEMRDYLVRWNRELAEETQRDGRPFMPVHIGIGINTGDCCVGNLGSDQRFDYSVVGNDVNLASRLEGQSKQYRVDIVIGQNTYERVAAYAAMELDLIKVRGKTQPVRIYALLGGPAMEASEEYRCLKAKHGEMLQAYRARRWEEALALIEECLRLDTPRTRLRVFYEAYRERIRTYLASPPGPDWDGVFTST